MKTLYLLRAVSGSGKTTLARQLEKMPNTVAISSDDYFYELGEGWLSNWERELVEVLSSKRLMN